MDKCEMTNGIPICPHCKEPTSRTGGSSQVTLMYYPPVYDKDGNNTNLDRNTVTSQWCCKECEHRYQTAGNIHDGFSYT